jgi:hypothetical protein
MQPAALHNGCDVIRTNVQASNGVIHVIDCVMFPPSPQPLPTQRTVGRCTLNQVDP